MIMEVTQEDIIQIANGFLLNAPPGEFMEVVTDVRGLIKDDSIINSTAPTTFRQYNTDQMLLVNSPKGNHRVVISKYGELSDAEYLDPRGNCVIRFDHIRQEVIGSRQLSGELDSSVENYRAALEEEAFKYAAEHYVNGAATVYGTQGKVIICIASEKFQPNNFWNGRWRSVWTCSISGGGIQLDGNIKINVHYYEDGNVQLVTNANKSGSVQGSNPQAAATAALKMIGKIEQAYQNAVENSYATMGDTTFKALRRVLPITRQRIAWNKIRGYRMGEMMSGAK